MALLSVLFAIPVAVSTASTALAADSVSCRSSASMFFAFENSGLEVDSHEEPEGGDNVWAGRQGIGSGWVGRMLAGPDGRVYLIRENGDVDRFRWLGSGWENGGVSERIATGWYGWNSPAFQNLITVDSKGSFYSVHDNLLVWAHFDEVAKKWSERAIDTGWQDKYDLITAAGDGVIFARTAAGDLFRFQYHEASQRWLEYGRKVGSGGWNNKARITSAGADILYALDGNSSELQWYRYIGAGNWADGPFSVGSDIAPETQISATSDACSAVNPVLPQRPTVPARPNAASYVIEGETGRLQHFHVDGAGRFVQGRQRSADPTVVDFTPINGYQDYVGTPSAVQDADKRVYAAALGRDSESRFSSRPAGTVTWPDTTSFGGWSPGPVVMAKRDNVGFAFTVDSAGKLWARRQDTATKDFLAWRPLTSTNLSSDITVVTQADGIDVFARTKAGLYTKATYNTGNGSISAWSTVPGTGWDKKAAGVPWPDKTLQVFATQADGAVVTLRETTTGFTGTWQALPAVTASGAPTAIVDANGLTHVAVRGTDSLIYVTEQVALGSNTFRPWQKLADQRTGIAYESATDPATAAFAAGGSAVTFRDADGVTYVFTSGAQAQTAAARSSADARTVYHGGPATKPKF
ncbi:tachylectin-related carbohydrate-binding protein [Amycolatopsis sp. NPDC059657]|uniref:tachylectin-related carbohydrate-binding protein n=1 Tax=Amycolatopsis sp. NPDC059657 TaxID=3346899 RepID=UPI00366D6EAF